MTAAYGGQARVLGAVTFAAGAITVLRPDALTRAAAEPDHSGPPAWIVRVLGARQLIQGMAILLAPTPAVLDVGKLVDVIHASSMLGLAAVSPRYRRAGLVSAATAAGFALASHRLPMR